jgi:predicted RNA binding protein YcfA (HicA-like mRNA interferase family)
MSLRQEVEQERKRLAKLGWKEHRHTGSGHVALRNEEHPEWGQVIVAISPSDHRVLKSMRREFAQRMGITLGELEIRMGIRQPKASSNGRAKRRAASPRVQARRRQAELRQRTAEKKREWKQPDSEPKPDPETEKERRRREYEEAQTERRLAARGSLAPASLPTVELSNVTEHGYARRRQLIARIHRAGGAGVPTVELVAEGETQAGVYQLLRRMRNEGLIDWLKPPRRGVETAWLVKALPTLAGKNDEGISAERLPTKRIRASGPGIETRRKAVEFITEYGTPTTGEIAEYLDITGSGAIHSLRVWRSEGLVEWIEKPRRGVQTRWRAKAMPEQATRKSEPKQPEPKPDEIVAALQQIGDGFQRLALAVAEGEDQGGPR